MIKYQDKKLESDHDKITATVLRVKMIHFTEKTDCTLLNGKVTKMYMKNHNMLNNKNTKTRKKKKNNAHDEYVINICNMFGI